MNFSLVQMICIANLYDCCKCIFYTVLFLYIFMFYDMIHILLSCDSLRDPWNLYCVVLYFTRYFLNSYDKIRLYHDDRFPLADTSDI